jgi:hypothetical protein
LQDQANDTEFRGPDAHFVWRITATSGAIQIHDVGGQLIGFVDPAFAWYEVEVIDPVTSHSRRKVTTVTPEFIYSISDNKEDSRRQATALGGSTRPLRRFTVRVNFVDRFGRRDAGQTLTVENPAPEEPEGIIVSGKISAINVKADQPDDDDLEGIRVYVGNTSGFSPSGPTTLVWKDAGNVTLIPDQPAGVTKFVRVAFADRFSDDPADLNLSSEIAVVVEAPEGPPIFTPESITFKTAGNTVFWTSGTIHISHGATLTSEAVSAGQATWTTGTLWLYYVQGFGSLQATTNPGTAHGDDRHMVAMYQGAKRLSLTGGIVPVANIVSVGATGVLGGGVNSWVTIMSCPVITTIGNDVAVNFCFVGTITAVHDVFSQSSSIEIRGRVRRDGVVLRDYGLASDSRGANESGSMSASTGHRCLAVLDKSVGAGQHTYDWQMRMNQTNTEEENADWQGIMMTATETLFT